MKLTKEQRETVVRAIDDVFYKLKARLSGRFFEGPRLYFSVLKDVNPTDTLEGLYRYTLHMLYGGGASSDQDSIKMLVDTTGNYIEAKKLQVTNKVMKAIEGADSIDQAFAAIEDELSSATDYVQTLTTTEARFTQSHAEKTGIAQVAAAGGDEDPTVVMLGKYDGKTCKHCAAMYHDPANPAKPVPYKLHSLKSGYFKPKEWDGHSGFTPGLHPSCRHVLSYVPKSFGFSESGQIKYVALDYDYYKDYHDIAEKSEKLLNLDELAACDCGSNS